MTREIVCVPCSLTRVAELAEQHDAPIAIGRHTSGLVSFTSSTPAATHLRVVLGELLEAEWCDECGDYLGRGALAWTWCTWEPCESQGWALDWEMKHLAPRSTP